MSAVSGVAPLLVVREDQRMASRSDFDELVELHHLRLVRLAELVCGDTAEAEDVVADAYARAWPRLARGQIDQPLAYLRQAVVNGAKSKRRHRFIVRREELRRRREPDSERASRQVEDRDLLSPALARLSREQRAVVALRFLEDLSESETAAVLGIPAGTVKSRCARALTALRQMIEERPDTRPATREGTLDA